MSPETADWIKAKLLASMAHPAEGARIAIRRFDDGAPGYVLYARP